MTYFVFFLICFIFSISSVSAESISGTISNDESGEPIPFATIIVLDQSQSILANEDGYFRINLPEGHYRIKFSHVAYYSVINEVTVGTENIETDIYLKPAVIELPTINVYDRNYDAAQLIIREAIKRKDEILSSLKQYNFDAYTKLVLRDTSKTDSTSMLLITETQVKAFWKYPDRYKQIITARKQSANLDAENNIVTISEILNFNKNRIDIGDHSLVSPTASDALEHYNYYLLDTVYFDSLMVFLLEVEPQNNTTPLFQGEIKIDASTYSVVGAELELNEAFDDPYMNDFSLHYEYQKFEDRYWMPTVIKYFAIFDIPFPLIPTIELDYTAALHKFHFEPAGQDTVFDEYLVEVDKGADKFDSTKWFANQLIPLSEMELIGYKHIDSLEKNKPLHKKLLPLIPASVYLVGYAQDYFHFNPVEGVYLGGKLNLNQLDERFSVGIKTGYAFDAELWQHRYRLTYLLDKKLKLRFGIEYHDEVRTQNTIISKPNGNSTLKALFKKVDPYNYHREKGFELTTSFKPFYHTTFSVSYNDFKQTSLTNNSDFSFFFKDSTYRENLPIKAGTLRSLKAKFQYDSSKLIKLKGKESKFQTLPYTLFSLGIEKADPSINKTDYDFTLIYTSLYTERRVLGIGIGKLNLYAGKTLSGNLPPQKYFTIDCGADMMGYGMTFKTFDKSNFSGSRVFSAYYNHDFGTMLFKKSRLPLIKDIPYSLNLHGGVFWTDLKHNLYQDGDEFLRQTDHPYSEIGLGIGRLPLLLKIYFTWQLSTYDTQKFYWGFDIGF